MTERRIVDVSALRIAYRVDGGPDTPPMVLLHGLTSDGSSWNSVLPAFSAHWRVYVPDLRGHGETTWPGEYAFGLMKDDLLGFLDRLDLERAVLVGHSMGGVAAYLLAQEHPGRVAALVLEETPPPVPHRRTVPERPPGPLSYDWAVRPAVVGQVNSPDPAWWEQLEAIKSPTLVIGGGPASPFDQDAIAAMADRIPGARMVSIPVGHGVHKEDPTEFVAAVTGFLADAFPGRRNVPSAS
ncbi:alpha/beta fold hydrolase [Actinopolymorpha sp. B11F2]|uniref:alpha/beta fold hydrolase n=1 Tax=Actinopolymorpha sp. B11F2 TaxID=3160862 RepID=UPI0032E3961D